MGLMDANRCPGCDCLNETEAASPTTPIKECPPYDIDSGWPKTPLASDWPCLDGIAVPCAYGAIFECSHPWIANDYYDGSPMGFCSSTIFGDGAFFTAPVVELKKVCLDGGRWSNDVTNEKTNFCIDCVNNYGGGTPIPRFPPFSIVDGAMVNYRARYVGAPSGGTLLDIENCTWRIADSEDERMGWTLDVATDRSTASMTHLFAGLACSGRDPFAFLGKPRPVYVLDAESWDDWGRNDMRLTDVSMAAWPSLKQHICIVPLQRPYLRNPCDSLEARCNCNDLGGDGTGDQRTFTLNITSTCSGLEGLREVVFTRYMPADWPAVDLCASQGFLDAPCGVWWAELGSISACESSTQYSGDIAVMLYCDGDGYTSEWFCWRKDLECWESQGTAALTPEEDCEIRTFAVTAPAMACCCPEGVDVCCCDGIPVPTSATLEVRDASDNVLATGINVTYDPISGRWESAAFSISGCEVDRLWFSCSGEPFCMWSGFVNFAGSGTNNALVLQTATCDPFFMRFFMDSLNCLNGLYFYIT